MQLSSVPATRLAQLQAIKQYVITNLGGIFEQPQANAMNAIASPSYFVWKSSVTRSDIYDTETAEATTWDWTVFKGQTTSEQGAWREMFMGDQGRIGQKNWRGGVGKIFTGTQAQTDQRNHVFNVGRRAATIAEKLLAVAVTNPPANSGNTVGQARGSAANPDNFGPDAEGDLTLQNLIEADSVSL